MADEHPLPRQADPAQQVALRRRDEGVGRHQPPPRLPVRRHRQGDGRGRGQRAPVAAVPQRGTGQAARAVVADRSIAEEVPAGAGELVIVDGGHHRHRLVLAGVEHRGGKQREGVVQVDHVGPVLTQDGAQLPARGAVPHDLGRQRRLARLGPALDVVAAALEPGDLVPEGGEGLPFLIHDAVLTAGRNRAVTAMDDHDLHARLPSGRTSSRGSADGMSSEAARTNSRR